ncbi:Tyrosine-protein kinase wzc [Paraburkholderia domus]|nr:Tyrosine-protein kinase wzc [Paraburkholderia domus]CAE6812604.1 Tyrosine-protein kinase wzc [Paraburkholderia domus]CAE6845715.1 Tyrosine-protein kinase wzc [Paraburkholderia domus]CAE6871834.1 Tyrosine-protein kinase wzc [Paraburkholderia domus]CAE6888502.1 Tyrosine-protein kinase wzc [Paraburkholderia domus]
MTVNHANWSTSNFEPAHQQPASTGHSMSAFYHGRWVIIGSTLLCLLAGIGYATFKQPVFRSDILIEVEQTPELPKSALGDVSSMFDLKTDVSSEIEVLKSRLVTSQAVNNLKLYIDAEPRYIPVVGWWLSERSDDLSTPLPGGYVSGKESIDVATLNVPQRLYSKTLKLTLGQGGAYTLSGGFLFGDKFQLQGHVGQMLREQTSYGPVELLVQHVDGKPGATFNLSRYSEAGTIEWLQNTVAVLERGKQSNIIGATLDGTDPREDSQILNEIGRAYIEQNGQRKSAEANKAIRFLDTQLPVLKAQLEAAEARLNAFRAEHGTLDTSQYGTALLQQSVADQVKVFDLKQRRSELMSRFTEGYPEVQAVDRQLQDAQAALAAVLGATQALPALEQSVLQLQRDVQVSSDLYRIQLGTRQQLTLVGAGKVSNVRLIDTAMPTEEPIQPRVGVVIGGSIISGLLIGAGLVFFRRRVRGRVDDPQEIEASIGLPVYATVPPHGRLPDYTRRNALVKPAAPLMLTDGSINCPTIESLRSFYAILQFRLPEARNRAVLITGPTAGIGKSFVSANLATLAGASNKRVLLIDADLRKGVLHQYLKVECGHGLSEVVAGTHHINAVLKRNVLPGLDFLSTGEAPSGPSEMLLRPELSNLIDEVSSQYDMVVIDGPPLLMVPDAIMLGQAAGAVFMVARHGVTTLPDIRESARRLAQAGVPIRGVVLNDFKALPGKYGYAGYAGYADSTLGDYRRGRFTEQPAQQ